MGPDHPRRLRPDRDDAADRQHRRRARSSPGRWAGRCPACPVALVDPLTGELADEGEIVLDLSQHPVNLMTGYLGDDERQAEAMAGGYYHTGDVAPATRTATSPTSAAPTTCSRRATTRSRPFELESVLIEHPAVAEAAVVPAPGRDPPGRAQGLRRAGPRVGARRRRPGRSWRTRASTSRGHRLHAPVAVPRRLGGRQGVVVARDRLARLPRNGLAEPDEGIWEVRGPSVVSSRIPRSWHGSQSTGRSRALRGSSIEEAGRSVAGLAGPHP